jgi:hypothetical protein
MVHLTLASLRLGSLLPMAAPGEEEEAETSVLQSAGAGGMTKLNEDGSFEMKDVPGGDYQLAIGAQADRFRDYYTKDVMMDGRDVVDTGFAVSGGATLDVLISTRGASIEGTVVNEKGQPVANAYVVTAPSSGLRGRPDSHQTARSDANGNFQLRGLNPGIFTVVALEKLKGDVRSGEFLQKYGGQGVQVGLEEGDRTNVQLTVVGEEAKQ